MIQCHLIYSHLPVEELCKMQCVKKERQEGRTKEKNDREMADVAH